MTPTPEELAVLIVKHNLMTQWPTQKQCNAFAHAVLAKWGTPTPAGEPVAWMDDFGNAFPLAANKGAGSWMDAHKRTWKPLYTAPPVREPLSRERVKEIVREAGYDTGPVKHKSDFINGIRHGERAHGITKGEPHDGS